MNKQARLLSELANALDTASTAAKKASQEFGRPLSEFGEVLEDTREKILRLLEGAEKPIIIELDGKRLSEGGRLNVGNGGRGKMTPLAWNGSMTEAAALKAGAPEVRK